MVTIFSNPRPFSGTFDVIQRNAIKSWLALKAPVEIILFDDEEHTTEAVARELGVTFLATGSVNEFGTPLIDYEFETVRKKARYDIIAQVNSDILLCNDFISSIAAVKRTLGDGAFFMIGRRWDLDVAGPVDFADTAWDERIRERIRSHGKLHGLSGIDYWVFPKSFRFSPLPFAAGRMGIDSWLVYTARKCRIPVIDASRSVTIVHQNHPYPVRGNHHFAVETERNYKLAGGFLHTMSIRDSDRILTEGILKRPEFPYNIHSALSLAYPWRIALAVKRKIQNAFAHE
jgi:hypothetical protein